MPALEVEEARAKAKAYGPGVLLGGAGSEADPGFDLGNSPWSMWTRWFGIGSSS